MRVDLVQIGYEISLALRNLKHAAQAEPTLADRVDVRLHEVRFQAFDRPTRFANNFTPFSAWEALLCELAEQRPAVLGLSCYLWNTTVSAQFAGHLKALSPDTLVVLGGPEVTHTANTVLQRYPGVDVVVRGEGEVTFVDLLKRLAEGGDPRCVAGTSWRTATGEVRHNPPREPMASLDGIPSPYEPELAERAPSLWRWDDFVIYETLRGCPHDCGFCLYGGGSRRVRQFSVERVADDLLGCLRAGLNVMVVDSSFGFTRSRARAILDRVIAGKPYSAELSIEAHADLLDESVVERLAEAGTCQVGLGLQTITGVANDVMERRLDTKSYRAVLDRLAAHDIYHYVDIIFGLPGDTWSGFVETVDFALAPGTTDVQFHRLLVLPGTRIHKDAAALGLAHAHEAPYEVLSTPTYSYRDLVRSHRLAFVFHLLHHAMGGGGAVRRLIAAAKRRPSELLMDVADFFEERGFLRVLTPETIGTMGPVVHEAVADYTRHRDLARAVEVGE